MFIHMWPFISVAVWSVMTTTHTISYWSNQRSISKNFFSWCKDLYASTGHVEHERLHRQGLYWRGCDVPCSCSFQFIIRFRRFRCLLWWSLWLLRSTNDVSQHVEAPVHQLTDGDNLENPGGAGRFFHLLKISASQGSGQWEIPWRSL